MRGESGAVMALAAMMIPVMLVLTALVVDVGNWFTHDRQLQNRADAGAFAAGVNYAASWAACVQSDDAILKASTADAIVAQARKYAGDPSATGPVNIEIANQAKLDVILNSTSYNAGTDYSDGGGPCFRHAGDDISPSGGYWLDVKVKERDIPSFFGSLGLPLDFVHARARIEIHPAVSDNGFIPLAIPETEIVQARVRYYDECTSPRTLLASATLKPLKTQYQTVTGTVLWGPDTGDPTVHPTSIPLTVPPSAHCAGQAYIPIGVEVAIAGRPYPQVDLSQDCSVLAPLRFADCWSDLSRIRVYKDTPSTEPWFKDVALVGSGTDGCSADPYFARNLTHCNYTVAVNMDVVDMLGDPALDIADNFELTVNGTAMTAQQGTATGLWTSDGALDNATFGASPVLVTWQWRDTDTSHSWSGQQCRPGGQNPCRLGPAQVPLHRLFLADDANAGIVDLIRTSQASQISGGQPSYPLSWLAAQLSTSMATIYPTIGLRSALTAGQYRVLRAAGPQGNQSVDCDPSGGQGHDFQMFMRGCDVWYGFNHFGAPDRAVWWTQYGDCPRHTEIFGQPNDPTDQGAWKCVPAAPGFSASVIADGIAARTGNCVSIQNNSCSRTACNYPSRYPSTPDPEWAPAPGDPRVVNLFVVPYGAFKGVNSQDGLPITKFPRFYVTGWGGHGSNDDPCPDDDPAEPGEIVGYFIAFGEPGGPVDSTLDCVPGDLTPCRTVLVR